MVCFIQTRQKELDTPGIHAKGHFPLRPFPNGFDIFPAGSLNQFNAAQGAIKNLTGRGQRHVRDSFKKGRPHSYFQFLDMGTQALLSHIGPFSGTGKVQFLRGKEKHFRVRIQSHHLQDEVIISQINNCDALYISF